MSDDYTPTDRDVEVAHIENRWLAEHDRQVAERAWGEGQKSGMRYADRMRAAYELGRPELPGPPSPNPYALSIALEGVQEESKA